MHNAVVVLAGATGNLGGHMAAALLEQGAGVRALVRRDGAPGKIEKLRRLGAEVAEADFGSLQNLTRVCSGASCVVSAMSGLRDVIVEAQASLLEAAVRAAAPRFIPSDFSIDYTRLPPGKNRNLDLRREFGARLDKASISATSILNGMFADLLTGQAPVVIFKLRRVVYWQDPDMPLDFTAMADVARFTANAALDPSTPRFLRIAGNRVSARQLAEVASQVTGVKFRLLRAGSLRGLEALINVTRAIAPMKTALYPPWQGMQYMRDMFSGRAKLAPLDNDRYPGMRWTAVREVLATRHLHQQRRM